MEKIENFKDLLENYVGPDRSIFDTKVSNLMLPGENYMSDIIKIDLTVKNKKTAATENLHFVAKLVKNTCIGPTADLTRNEILFYGNIVPALENFQKRHGVMITNFFPNYIAGKINLDDSDVPDQDAVMILENLKEQGYENIDRLVGFDLDGAKLVLKDLALFHAVPLAMRLLEPETYKSEILKNIRLFVPDISEEQQKLEPNKEELDLFNVIVEVVKSNEKYCHLLPPVKSFFQKFGKQFEEDPFFTKKLDTQFETLTHEDMWLNNTMQLSQDGKLYKNFFVDFQMIRSSTIFNDLIVFLFSSVQTKCLEENFDQLLKFYHENFSNTLKSFGCFSNEYTYEKFLEAFPKECKKGLIQCSFMILAVIFVEKGKAREDKTTFRLDEVTLKARERVAFLFQEADKRGWLL